MIAMGLVFLSCREAQYGRCTLKGTSGVSLSSRARKPIITQGASYKHWMEKASRKQTIFNSKPRGVTAWIFLGKKLLRRLKTVSMYWRIGFPKNFSYAGSGRLEFFLRWALRCKPISSSRSS